MTALALNISSNFSSLNTDDVLIEQCHCYNEHGGHVNTEQPHVHWLDNSLIFEVSKEVLSVAS